MRGFNVHHMPISYLIKETQEKRLAESRAMLVQTPEPDFSMPFNVIAVTNVLLGVFFINMYNVLSKPNRFIYSWKFETCWLIIDFNLVKIINI